MPSITLPIPELRTALLGLSKVIPRRSTLPVLSHLRIERLPNGSLELAGTDLDSAAVVRLDTPEPGAPVTLLAPFTDLNNVAKSCGRGDPLVITPTAPDRISIRFPAGGQVIEHRCQTLPAEEFPPLPEISGTPVLLNETARRAIHEAFECASDDETRYVLNGAFLDVSQPGCHQVAGTNGRIMYSANSFRLTLERSVILPTHRFLSWKPFLNDGDWTMKLADRAKDAPAAFEITSLSWRFYGKEVEGNYPNYRQVVPDGCACQTMVEFDPERLAEVIRTAERMPCHDSVNHTIQLEVRKKSILLLGKSPGAESWAEVEIPPARASGKEVKIAFNRQYLIRALSFGLNTVQIIDAMSPARFSQGGRQMVVMPIRADAAAGHQPNPAPASPAAKPAASPTAPPPEPIGSTNPSPAPAPSAEAGASTTERNQPMQSSQTTPPAADHGNSAGNNSHSEPPSSLLTAQERIEAIKGSCREAIRGLSELADLLRQAARDQKASEKEISSVRQTLRSLQSVRI